jgi:hypothetical protein
MVTASSSEITPLLLSRLSMDIPPYTSSSAFSREQYALVRKVELASASNIADGYILAEVDVLRKRLLDTGLGIDSVSPPVLFVGRKLTRA